jgi:hypothetical protein
MQDFESHVSQCAECRESLQAAKELLTALRQIPVEPASADFEQRVFNEVRSRYPDESRSSGFNRFASGFATAAVAGLAIWFVSTLYQSGTDPDLSPLEPQVITVSMQQASTVRLEFDANNDIEQVSLTITLPGNMEVDGYPGRHQLSWNTRLSEGQNVLALPILALDPGQGELVARLSYGDKEQIFRVLLESSTEGVFRSPLVGLKHV